jgi:hypothetical protein
MKSTVSTVFCADVTRAPKRTPTHAHLHFHPTHPTHSTHNNNMASALPPCATGIWAGQTVGGSGDSAPLLWNLTLAEDPSGFVPSAFGATLIDGAVVRVLQGAWDFRSMAVELSELSTEAGAADLATFRGKVGIEEDGALSIKGTFSAGPAGEDQRKGVFAVRREADDDRRGAPYDAAVYIGKARPDPSLEAFAIPTNPVYCTLAFLRRAEGPVNAFGVGYLNDSGDVPDKPVLFYTLQGTHDAASGAFRVAKRYQFEAETSGYEVEYEGELTPERDDGFAHLEGKWSNPKGGSFGSLNCRRLQPSIPTVIMRLALATSAAKVKRAPGGADPEVEEQEEQEQEEAGKGKGKGKAA